MKIQRDEIVDLEFLKDLDVRELEIDAPAIAHVESLNGKSGLIYLAIRPWGSTRSGDSVIDLSPLHELPDLTKLVLGPGVYNISFLKDLPSITELVIEDAIALHGIESVTNLRKLTVGSCAGLQSLQPLKALNLESLTLARNRFNKRLWTDFLDYIATATDVSVNVEKYKNIRTKQIMKIPEMNYVSAFEFCEDNYWGNSFSFRVERP
jgi:hypothetical protein